MFPFDFPAIHVTSIPWRAETTPPITQPGKIHTDTYRRLPELQPVKLASACVRQGTIMWMVVPVLSVGTWRSSRKPAYVTQRDGPNKTARSTPHIIRSLACHRCQIQDKTLSAMINSQLHDKYLAWGGCT